jgi:glycosyltransferase involved in cell wall biosynthesis
MPARRILFVENSIGLSGSTMSLVTLLNHLDRGRFAPRIAVSRPEQAAYIREHLREPAEIAVVSPRRGLKQTAWLRRLGSPDSRVPRRLRRSALRVGGLLDLLVVALPYALRLRRFAGRDVDLIHQNNGFDFGAVMLALMLRRPLVAYQRGDEWNSPVVRWFARRVAAFVANSLATKRSLDGLGVPDARVAVIYPPLDLQIFDAVRGGGASRAALGIDGDTPVVGIVGIMVPWKGHRVFLRAVRAVRDQVPRVRAFIIGGHPPGGEAYVRELAALAAELGVSDRVTFTGFRADVAALLPALDVVIHASVEPEPFGRVITEAMAMKRPVVASAAGGPVEIIEDGRSGYLVPPGDPDALAARVVELLKDPSRAEEIGERAAQDVARRFSAEAHARLMEQVYDRVLGAHISHPVVTCSG